MGKIIFILGGARSGKSTYALRLAKEGNNKVAFIATCTPCDKEMEERIDLHKKKRPSSWQTFEEPKDLGALVKKIKSDFNIIIIDCLTLLISNLLSEGLTDSDIESKISEVLDLLKPAKCTAVVVSNEVGLGIVPENQLARRFRDLAGRVNQVVAKEAIEVLFMASGIPVKIKGGRK